MAAYGMRAPGTELSMALRAGEMRPDHRGLWNSFLNTTLAMLRLNAEQYRLEKIHNLDGRMLADIGLDADALDAEATSLLLPGERAPNAYWAAAALQ